MSEQDKEMRSLAAEEQVSVKYDEHGNRWNKVYFGGGSHFRNWLEQAVELRGEENVQIEEVAIPGLRCYEEGGEKMYRIWVRDASQIRDLA